MTGKRRSGGAKKTTHVLKTDTQKVTGKTLKGEPRQAKRKSDSDPVKSKTQTVKHFRSSKDADFLRKYPPQEFDFIDPSTRSIQLPPMPAKIPESNDIADRIKRLEIRFNDYAESIKQMNKIYDCLKK